ncbi:MAG: hypothetical protein HYZ75_15010 [Elusimicrobia bacterium]|nr:hypothetical protein [Elusimicrobiota bacterium]
MRAALAAAGAAAALNLAFSSVSVPRLPARGGVSLAGEGVVAGAALWSLGMRRLGADLGFINLLVYYGTHDEDHDGHEHAAAGGYEDLLPRARRIRALDPYWSYPVLYAAGALAFNLERPDEALALLDEALALRPGDRELLATVAAVGFQKKGDLTAALERLMTAVDGPDAPTMLKNMAAFMNERLGRRETAARLYREILESRDASYHEAAERGLARLR